jgi:hypothetical protein
MAAVPEEVLQKVRAGMRGLKPPGHYDKVYKEECMFSYQTPEAPGGLYVNLKTFMVSSWIPPVITSQHGRRCVAWWCRGSPLHVSGTWSGAQGSAWLLCCNRHMCRASNSSNCHDSCVRGCHRSAVPPRSCSLVPPWFLHMCVHDCCCSPPPSPAPPRATAGTFWTWTTAAAATPCTCMRPGCG